MEKGQDEIQAPIVTIKREDGRVLLLTAGRSWDIMVIVMGSNGAMSDCNWFGQAWMGLLIQPYSFHPKLIPFLSYQLIPKSEGQ